MEPLSARQATGLAQPARGEGPGPGATRLRQLRESAQEFESLLIQRMLRGAREAGGGSGAAAGGLAGGFHRDLADQELGRAMARSGGLGLADILARALARQAGAGETGSSQAPGRPMNRAVERDLRAGGGR